MGEAGRDYLSKGCADVAKGVFVGAPIAIVADKITHWEGLSLMALSVGLYNLGYWIAVGQTPSSSDTPTQEAEESEGEE